MSERKNSPLPAALCALHPPPTFSYEEFLVAAMDRKLLEYQKNIWWAFCTYDLDGDGKITAEELKGVLPQETRESLASIIAEYDQNGDGFIDYKEFMMCVHPPPPFRTRCSKPDLPSHPQ